MPIAPLHLIANADTDRIVTGESLTIGVELFYAGSKQTPAIVGASGIFPLASGVISIPATLDSNPGRIEIPLTSAETLQLNVADQQTWEVHALMSDGSLRKCQLVQQLDVVAALASIPIGASPGFASLLAQV
jgi:hypothetical protein